LAKDPRTRGQEAVDLIGHPMLRDAVNAAHEWATRTFSQAKTPEEAWNARLRMMACDEFAAYLLAVIQLGKTETEKIVREHEDMKQKKRDDVSLDSYLTEAREARAEYDQKRGLLAKA